MHMRLASSALACALAAAGAAHADGLQPVVDDVVVAPPPAASFDWTGFYAGGFLGLAYSETETNDYWCNYAACDAPGTDGLVGQIGATGGYNWQRGNFLYGVEADIAFAGGTEQIVEESFDEEVDYEYRYRSDLNTIATVRGRAGLAVNDTLAFVTAGLGFANSVHSVGDYLDGQSDARSEGESEGVALVAGAGVEHLLRDDVSVKAEYLFMGSPSTFGCWQYESDGECFSDLDTDGVYYRNELHIVRLGVNYHF